MKDVAIEIVPPGDPVTLFPVNVITNREVGGQQLPPPDEDGPNVVGPFVAVPPGLEARQIIVDVPFPRGLFDLAGSRLKGASVTWSVDIRPMDELGRNTGPRNHAAVCTRRQAKTTPQRITRRISVASGRWRVCCRRLSASGLVSPNGQDRIVWAGCGCWSRGPEPSPT